MKRIKKCNNFVDNKKNNELNEIVNKIIVGKKRCLKLISISANDIYRTQNIVR